MKMAEFFLKKLKQYFIEDYLVSKLITIALIGFNIVVAFAKTLTKTFRLHCNIFCITFVILKTQLKPTTMAKSQDKEKKEVKKPAVKSLKEKRLEKKEKKAGKS